MSRLYLRSKKLDMMDTITRCYFDADNGRVKLALERLKDLEDEIGEDAHISYAEGILWRDHLGKGVQAYHCFTKALNLDPSHADSAFNAAILAPDEANFRRCAEISNTLSAQDTESFIPALEALSQGLSYLDFLLGRLQAATSPEREPGPISSLMEVALLAISPSSDEELALRKGRAQLLRQLDLSEAQLRETMAEDYPAEERLALSEGLAELDKILVLDEWDSEMWNFKSAWSLLLRNFPQAVACADRAIELRPDGYCRPYHNKATALWEMGKRDEALVSLEIALHQAEISSQPEEIERLKPLLDAWLQIHQNNLAVASLSQAQPFLKRIVTAAGLTAKKDLEALFQSDPASRGFQGSIFEFAATAFNQRIERLRRDPHDAMPYVPAMAQALSYMGPEACLSMLNVILTRGGAAAYENCMLATLYIAAHAEPIMQRDALRLLILTILMPALTTAQEADIRDVYRKLILEVSAAATDELAQLDALMRFEMAKILRDLPIWVANQEQVDQRGIERAKNKILRKLQGEPFVNRAENFQIPGLTSSGRAAIPGQAAPMEKVNPKVGLTGCAITLVVFFGFLVLKFVGVIPYDWIIVVPVALVGGFLIGRVFARIVDRNSD